MHAFRHCHRNVSNDIRNSQEYSTIQYSYGHVQPLKSMENMNSAILTMVQSTQPKNFFWYSIQTQIVSFVYIELTYLLNAHYHRTRKSLSHECRRTELIATQSNDVEWNSQELENKILLNRKTAEAVDKMWNGNKNVLDNENRRTSARIRFSRTTFSPNNKYLYGASSPICIGVACNLCDRKGSNRKPAIEQIVSCKIFI